MKRIYLKSFFTLFFTLLITSIYAQERVDEPTFSYSYLGIHCYVSVDLNNDPIDGGYLKYTIPVPNEGLSSIQGPASAHLLNNLGDTVDIYVNRLQLELALADRPYAQVPFELYVPVWKLPNGITSTSQNSGASQCFYFVVFNINTLN